LQGSGKRDCVYRTVTHSCGAHSSHETRIRVKIFKRITSMQIILLTAIAMTIATQQALGADAPVCVGTKLCTWSQVEYEGQLQAYDIPPDSTCVDMQFTPKSLVNSTDYQLILFFQKGCHYQIRAMVIPPHWEISGHYIDLDYDSVATRYNTHSGTEDKQVPHTSTPSRPPSLSHPR
jgi:hypothetical protein